MIHRQPISTAARVPRAASARMVPAASARMVRGACGCVLAALAGFAAAEPPAKPAAAPASAPAHDPVAAIRAAARRYQEAFQQGDGAALAALWTPDGDIVDDQGRVLNGREAVAGITAPSADGPQTRIKETKLRLLTDDVAIEDGTVEVTPPGAAVPLVGWFSATWVRRAGAWQLAGVRESQIASPHDAARLADLDWMVGDWTVVEDHPDRPADAAATADGAAIELSVRWNATRTFLLRDMKIGPARQAAAGGAAVTAGGDDLPAMQITQRIGWDPLSRQIVSWVFGSDGSHGEATWTRDGTTWIARTSAVHPDGTQTSSLNIYTYDGDDRCTWRSVPTHIGGEHAPHVTMTMIRRPRRAEPSPATPRTSSPRPSQGSPAR